MTTTWLPRLSINTKITCNIHAPVDRYVMNNTVTTTTATTPPTSANENVPVKTVANYEKLLYPVANGIERHANIASAPPINRNSFICPVHNSFSVCLCVYVSRRYSDRTGANIANFSKIILFTKFMCISLRIVVRHICS